MKNFKQAIKVTHTNVRQVMELPCIIECRKSYDRFQYCYMWEGKYSFVHEGNWLVEHEDGWKIYNDEDWKKREL